MTGKGGNGQTDPVLAEVRGDLLEALELARFVVAGVEVDGVRRRVDLATGDQLELAKAVLVLYRELVAGQSRPPCGQSRPRDPS